MATDLVPFIPVYIAIFAIAAALFYFVWNSRKIALEATEQFNLVDIIAKTTQELEKSFISMIAQTTQELEISVLKNVSEMLEKSLSIDVIGQGLLEYFITVINDKDAMEEIRPALAPLTAGFLPGGIPSLDPADIAEDVAGAVLNIINSGELPYAAQMLSMAMGEDWETQVKSNPQRAMALIKNLKGFGVFDLVEGVKNKITNSLQGAIKNPQGQITGNSGQRGSTW